MKTTRQVPLINDVPESTIRARAKRLGFPGVPSENDRRIKLWTDAEVKALSVTPKRGRPCKPKE